MDNQSSDETKRHENTKNQTPSSKAASASRPRLQVSCRHPLEAPWGSSVGGACCDKAARGGLGLSESSLSKFSRVCWHSSCA
jgi:hypothetical protein